MGGQTLLPMPRTCAVLVIGVPSAVCSRTYQSGNPCARASSRGVSIRIPMSAMKYGVPAMLTVTSPKRSFVVTVCRGESAAHPKPCP